MRHRHTKHHHHFSIPAITILVAILGALFTEVGMPWYENDIILPSLLPPDWLFPIVWTALYIMIAGAAYIVWHEGPKKMLHLFATPSTKEDFRILKWLFISNAVLNVLWTLLFFTLHWITVASIEIVLLEITIVGMIALSWRVSKTAAYLLIPYAVWVLFATYLTMRIAFLN